MRECQPSRRLLRRRSAPRHAKRIHGTKIHIPRDEHLDAIALRLGDRRRDVRRCFAAPRSSHRWSVDGLTTTEPLVVLGVHRPLHRTVDDGDQNRRAEAIPEVPVDLAGKPRAPELIGSRRAQAAPRRRSACALPSRARRSGPSLAAPGRGSRRRASCPARGAPRFHRH